ncbi:hypothetical protein [Actinomycetospora sp. NBC_00405]|uniref:hypothetical protein n=1 Tax=Actinomycetospora sp. NBC_00405 TaxID=2975952 RepID=UPI002E226E1D
MSEDREPDVEFSARVQARRLRFEAVPEVRIDASVSGSDRVNLPDRVERHVTYEDVHIDHAMLSWLEPPAEEPPAE